MKACCESAVQSVTQAKRSVSARASALSTSLTQCFRFFSALWDHENGIPHFRTTDFVNVIVESIGYFGLVSSVLWFVSNCPSSSAESKYDFNYGSLIGSEVAFWVVMVAVKAVLWRNRYQHEIQPLDAEIRRLGTQLGGFPSRSSSPQEDYIVVADSHSFAAAKNWATHLDRTINGISYAVFGVMLSFQLITVTSSLSHTAPSIANCGEITGTQLVTIVLGAIGGMLGANNAMDTRRQGMEKQLGILQTALLGGEVQCQMDPQESDALRHNEINPPGNYNSIN